MDGPQSGSGRLKEEINLLLLPEFEPKFLVRPVGSVATVYTELSQLRDLCSGRCFVLREC
jgi:hypothetical protein